MRNEIPIREVVGLKGKYVYFLEYLFDLGNGTKGAVGFVLRPVPKDEYEECTAIDFLSEEFREVWKDLVCSDSTELGLREWIEENREELISILYEEAPFFIDQKVREVLNLSEEEYPVLAVESVGRVFDKELEFDKLINPKLWELIKEFES